MKIFKDNWSDWLAGMSDEAKSDFLKTKIKEEQETERQKYNSYVQEYKSNRLIAIAVISIICLISFSISGYHIVLLWESAQKSQIDLEHARINKNKPNCSPETCSKIVKCSSEPIKNKEE